METPKNNFESELVDAESPAIRMEHVGKRERLLVTVAAGGRWPEVNSLVTDDPTVTDEMLSELLPEGKMGELSEMGEACPAGTWFCHKSFAGKKRRRFIIVDGHLEQAPREQRGDDI